MTRRVFVCGRSSISHGRWLLDQTTARRCDDEAQLETAAQPGGELLAALDDLSGGDPERQVNLGQPASPVRPRRTGEGNASSLPSPQMAVDTGDAQVASRPGDDVLGGRLRWTEK